MILLFLVLLVIAVVCVIKYVGYMNSTYYKVTKKPFLAMRTDVGTYGEYCIFKLLKSYENKGAKFLLMFICRKARVKLRKLMSL